MIYRFNFELDSFDSLILLFLSLITVFFIWFDLPEIQVFDFFVTKYLNFSTIFRNRYFFALTSPQGSISFFYFPNLTLSDVSSLLVPADLYHWFALWNLRFAEIIVLFNSFDFWFQIEELIRIQSFCFCMVCCWGCHLMMNLTGRAQSPATFLVPRHDPLHFRCEV